jgi:hypothetical protein
LNTSFVRDGEVSIPLSYVTGTLVKLGQGIERHLSGGVAAAWLGYFLLYVSFLAGATIGGCISLVLNGSAMLAVAAAGCALTTGYTYCHADRHVLLEVSGRRDLGRSLPRIIRRGRSRRNPGAADPDYSSAGSALSEGPWANSFRNPSSSRTGTPSSTALSYFEPGESPATR